MKLHQFTLRKFNRIKSKKVFQHVYKNGHSVVDGMSVLYILPVESPFPCLGCAVGKKLGGAVVRNSIKRKMREVFRVRKNEIKTPVSIVWVARKKLAAADLAAYDRVFVRLARRAGIMD